jgi:hypothetical protein
MNALLAVIGFILLVAGHQSHWFFAAGVGFLAGSLFLARYQPGLGMGGMILYSLAYGVLGALAAGLFKKVVIPLAVFAAGAYLCYFLPDALGWSTSWVSLPVALGSGGVALIAYILWRSLPLILITATLGATLIIRHFSFGSIGVTAMFILLLFFGLIAQWVLFQYKQPENP